MRTAVERMLDANQWWQAAFCVFSVMGWIFNSFGLGMVIFTWRQQQAVGFFAAGIGLWILAGTVIGLFMGEPSPRTRHRR